MSGGYQFDGQKAGQSGVAENVNGGSFRGNRLRLQRRFVFFFVGKGYFSEQHRLSYLYEFSDEEGVTAAEFGQVARQSADKSFRGDYFGKTL